MIKRKIIRGKIRYYAQLVCDGKPYQKEGNQVIQGKIGLDLGPSTIAEVSNTGAKLDLFCFSRGEAQPKKPSLWAGGCFVVLDVLYNSGLHYEGLCDFRIVPFLLKEKLPEKLLCSVIYIRADLDFHI